MFSNPLIRRYCISQFRFVNLSIFGSLYISVLFILFLVNGSIYQYQTIYNSLQDLYYSLFIQFLILQGVLLWLLMPVNSSSVIPGEIADKSFDFFRMLPLSCTQKATGVLIGRNLFYLIVAAVNFCLFLFFGLAGDVSGNLMTQLFLLTASGMMALNCTSFLFSTLSFKKSNTGVSLSVIIMILCASPFVGAMVSVVGAKEKFNDIFFLDYQVPLLYLISGYLFVVALWSFLGILRRFKYEYEPLFSRTGAVLFYICYLFLIYALFHHYLLWEPFIPEEYPSTFSLVALLPLGIIPFCSMRSFDKYIEITRSSKHRVRPVSALLLRSNFIFNLVLFVLWAAAVLMTCYFTQKSMDRLPVLCCLIFTAYLVMIALCELFVLYQHRAAKIGYLLAFIGGVYLILPLILAGVLDNEYLSWFSPIGLTVSFTENRWQIQDFYIALIFNCLLALIPLCLIINKYITISRLRSAIENRTK